MKFAREIIKNSKVKLFLVNNNIQLAKFLKKICMVKRLLLEWGQVLFLIG